tara:strand:+ start:44 stop:199 length:156 start_codon:yes stop_codon:yes gene_type:complete
MKIQKPIVLLIYILIDFLFSFFPLLKKDSIGCIQSFTQALIFNEFDGVLIN